MSRAASLRDPEPIVPEPFYDDGQITLYCGDCRPMLLDVVADVVVTDPPFTDRARDGAVR